MIKRTEELILKDNITNRYFCSQETWRFATDNFLKSSSNWTQMGTVTSPKLLAWSKFKIKKLEVKMKLVLTSLFGLHPESFAWYFWHFVFQVNFLLRLLILWYSATLVPPPAVTELPVGWNEETSWKGLIILGWYFFPPKVDLRGC